MHFFANKGRSSNEIRQTLTDEELRRQCNEVRQHFVYVDIRNATLQD